MTMEYKGYVAKLDIDPEADLLSGEVLGLRDVITFQGRTPADAEKAFRDSVDDYLKFCKQRGEPPEKPRLRASSWSAWTRRRTGSSACNAAASGASLNTWVNRAIARELKAAVSSGGPAPSPAASGPPGKAGRAKPHVGQIRRAASASSK